jgi:hypothetical protein
MIIFGATVSRLAHGNYVFLLGVAILDIGIGTALLGSSVVFWRQRAFSRWPRCPELRIAGNFPPNGFSVYV